MYHAADEASKFVQPSSRTNQNSERACSGLRFRYGQGSYREHDFYACIPPLVQSRHGCHVYQPGYERSAKLGHVEHPSPPLVLGPFSEGETQLLFGFTIYFNMVELKRRPFVRFGLVARLGRYNVYTVYIPIFLSRY